MSNTLVLTEDDKEVIRQFAEQGLGPDRIAKVVKRHPSTVNWFMYRDGLKAARPAPATQLTYVRNGYTVYRYTDAEDEFIEKMRTGGAGPTAIARAASERFGTSRTAHGISVRLTMLAGRDEAA